MDLFHEEILSIFFFIKQLIETKLSNLYIYIYFIKNLYCMHYYNKLIEINNMSIFLDNLYI